MGGLLKFVIPFVGGALTAAAVIASKSKDTSDTAGEIDAEFEEKEQEDE